MRYSSTLRDREKHKTTNMIHVHSNVKEMNILLCPGSVFAQLSDLAYFSKQPNTIINSNSNAESGSY